MVPENEPADVRVLNSCTVTAQADATTRQRIRRLRRLDPGAHLMLTGCSVDANPGAYTTVDSIFANRDKDSIAEHILAMSRHEDEARRRVRSCARARSSRCRTAATIAARTASSGRRAARRSSIPARIVQERVRAAIDAGHAEIVLCGVDLGSYGRDVGTDLPTLVGSLLDVVRRARAHPAQQHQRQRRDAGADRAQRAPTALRALAYAAAERQRSTCFARCTAATGARSTCVSCTRCVTMNPLHRVHDRHHGRVPR